MGESLRDCAERRLARVAFRDPLKRLRPLLRVAPGRIRRARAGAPQRVCCELVLQLPDSVDGVTRSFTTAFWLDLTDTSEAWLGAVVAALLDRAKHEIGESILLDGTAVLDPHTR